MTFFESSTWKGNSRALPTLPRCGACGLYKTCKSPKMLLAGAGVSPILYVGEAPGAAEDEKGKPFIGEAGQTLRWLLAECGAALEDGWATNAAICRPPGNEIADLHIESCRPNVTNTILEKRPEVIILLGKSAVQSVVAPEWAGDLGEIGRWAGWQIPSGPYGAWLCPTYHPSFVARQREDPALVKIVKGHLKGALRKVGSRPVSPSLADLSRRVEVISTVASGIKRMEALAAKEGRLAFDYETTGLKPEREEQRIYCVSFCLEGQDTFACPVTPASYPALSAILRNPRLQKIASNIKFEERWTRKKLGHPVAGWEWDTLLAAHTLDNRRGVASIKFQAYVRFGIGDYNQWAAPYFAAPGGANGLNSIDKAPQKDVLVYCGLDSLLEYMVAVQQMEELGL